MQARPYPGRKLHAPASSRAMLRFVWLSTLLGSAVLAAAAPAAQQTFAFPVGGRLYSPAQITLGASDTVCWSPQAVTFSQHPLTFDTGDLPDNGSTSSSDYCPDISGLRPGFYAFHCAIHGTAGTEGSVGSGMAGSFTIPGDTTATPDFAIVQDGATVTLSYTGTADPDPGDAITKYVWDFDGNGTADATATASSIQHTYTANGTFHPTLQVLDRGHELSSTATHDVVVSALPETQPPPTGGGTGGTGASTTGPSVDTRAPLARITLARVLRTRVRLAFTSDEPGSVTATLRAGRRRVSVKRSFALPGLHPLTLIVPATLRHRRAALTLVVRDAAGNATTLKRALRLR